MRYLTIKEIKEKYWYNQYQLQNLRKNNKVSFKEKPFMYLEEDIIKAKKEDFIYETIVRTKNFNLWKFCSTEKIEEYMKIFGKEFRRVLFWMLKGKFNMELNKYSKYWPFNSYDNRSLFTLAQWEASRYQEQWKSMKENFEKWKKWKTKKEINDRKLYLERSFQKIRIKRKDFLYFIWDDDKINCRMKIENWYLYLLSFDWKRREKIYCWMTFPKWKQTITITKNKNWKIICSVSYHVEKKKKKYKWTCWIDVNSNNLSVVCVDNNWCLKKRKTFKLWNIVNLRNKEVEVKKLLKKIKVWSKWYKPVLEDLNLSWCYKNRKLSNIIYWIIRKNSFMLWKEISFVKANYTSFIWLTKYSNLWMSKKHFWWSKDESAWMVIARRWLWFKEKLPKFEHKWIEYQWKNYKEMNNWNYWSYLKNKVWENWTRNLFFKLM